MNVGEILKSALTLSSRIKIVSWICLFSFGDLDPQDGESQPDNPPTEVVKHRRLFSRGVGNRPRGYKVKTSADFPPLPVYQLIQPGSSCIFGKCFFVILVVC